MRSYGCRPWWCSSLSHMNHELHDDAVVAILDHVQILVEEDRQPDADCLWEFLMDQLFTDTPTAA